MELEKEEERINPFDLNKKIDSKSEKWVVLYDIRNPKRLRKVAKIMESYGVRVQKSVFEVLAPSDVINRLRYRIQKVIHVEDYILYINVCEEDWQNQIKYGLKATGYQEKDYYVL